MVRFKGFQNLEKIERALLKFFDRIQPQTLDCIRIPVQDGLERILAKGIIADFDLPSFDRSAVDGYAIRAIDSTQASQFQPKRLRLVEKESVEEFEAREIWTGNALPKGSDAVIMLEYTRSLDNKIEVFKTITPGANVSKKGEDISVGEVVVKAGTKLKPQHLGLLASLRVNNVDVVKKPKISIFATGNELVPIGKKLKEKHIVEVNSLILSGMCYELGCEPSYLGIKHDNEIEIAESIIDGLKGADILITTGGTSVGAYDLVPKALTRVEPNSIIVHGIAIRPGMPTALAAVQGKPVIVLSGNPVAAVIGFEAFARPLILKLLGVNYEPRIRIHAKMTRRVAGALGRHVFLRVKLDERDGEFLADPVRAKGSGIITSLSRANGYVIIPEDREGLRENENVVVHLFNT